MLLAFLILGNRFWPITDVSAKLMQFGRKPCFIKTWALAGYLDGV